jgi:hypothetical protein
VGVSRARILRRRYENCPELVEKPQAARPVTSSRGYLASVYRGLLSNVRPLASVRGRRVMVAGLVFATALSSVPMIAPAITLARTVTVSNIDPATCSSLLAGVRTNYDSAAYGPQLKRLVDRSSLDSFGPTSCRLVTTVQGYLIPLPPNPVSAASSYEQFWGQYDLYIGPIWDAAQFHVNVGLVWSNTSSRTRTWSYKIAPGWGPDCVMTAIVGYYGGTDSGGWCGVYDPGDNSAMPGANFYLGCWCAPLQKRWFWMRYYAYSNGMQGVIFGGQS